MGVIGQQSEFHPNIAYMFLFSFLVFEKKQLRVCGAEVEWTLRKGGGGFEFAMKFIAYHSLSPSFSPLKSIIFLVSPLCHFRFMWMVNWCRIDQSKLRLVTVCDSSPSLSSCDIVPGRDKRGRLR